MNSGVFVLLLGLLVPVESQESLTRDFPSRESRILELKTRFGAESVGIYFQPAAGDVFTLNADLSFHAASTMKIPVMMEIFRQAEQGQLKLNQPARIRNEFKSIAVGAPYRLNPDEDSDPWLYTQAGKLLPLRHLMRRMISRSSNLATNLLLETAGVERVQQLLAAIGATGMTLLRGVEDKQAFRAGWNTGHAPFSTV
jgi:beta-lactamase class A